MDEDARFELVRCLFSDDLVALSTAILQLEYFENQHNRLEDKSTESEEDRLLILEHLLELEKIFIARVKKEVENGTFLDNDLALNIIWLLEQIDENTAKECADNMIRTDMDLAKLISACVFNGKGVGRTVFKMWEIKRDDINKYTDIDSAFERMKDFVHTDEFAALSNEKQEDIAAFLVDMERTETNRIRNDILIGDIEKKLKEIKR